MLLLKTYKYIIVFIDFLISFVFLCFILILVSVLVNLLCAFWHFFISVLVV